MELAFDSRQLRTICEDEAQAKLELGATVAEMLKRRLADMRAATSPDDLIAGRPRAGDDSLHMVVDLSDGYRITFKANHTTNPLTQNNDVDWAKVSRIKIMHIEREHA